jgi:hypothetical protein
MCATSFAFSCAAVNALLTYFSIFCLRSSFTFADRIKQFVIKEAGRASGRLEGSGGSELQLQAAYHPPPDRENESEKP